MRASLQTPPVQRSHLSDDAVARLRDLLVTEARIEQAQRLDHQAAAGQLRDHTDADSVLERELAEAGAARAREAIEEIDAALRRLDLGTYGSCEACGAPMPFERIEAVPSARRCVDCPGRGAGLLRGL